MKEDEALEPYMEEVKRLILEGEILDVVRECGVLVEI